RKAERQKKQSSMAFGGLASTEHSRSGLKLYAATGTGGFKRRPCRRKWNLATDLPAILACRMEPVKRRRVTGLRAHASQLRQSGAVGFHSRRMVYWPERDPLKNCKF